MRPGAPLSPGLTEKTRYKPAWFTSGSEVSRDLFRRPPAPAQPFARDRCGPGERPPVALGSVPSSPGLEPLLGTMWLADALAKGPVEDLRDLGRGGDRPDL